uniref:MOSC domain-containing protein n=1 Tax=Panagrellus redivivus TaxID=6233 RepID=A0A7E4UL88_PANRE
MLPSLSLLFATSHLIRPGSVPLGAAAQIGRDKLPPEMGDQFTPDPYVKKPHSRAVVKMQTADIRLQVSRPCSSKTNFEGSRDDDDEIGIWEQAFKEVQAIRTIGCVEGCNQTDITKRIDRGDKYTL